MRVKELLELHWEITQQDQNIGCWDITRLNLDTAREALKNVDCSWTSENAAIQPHPVNASDMRILFRGMTALTHLYLPLPMAADAWSESNGLLYILENLTDCHLTFCINGTEYPDLQYLSRAEELSFTTKQDNQDNFWDWLFYSQARLLLLRTLKLGTRTCTYDTMGGRTNWKGIGRTFPRTLQRAQMGLHSSSMNHPITTKLLNPNDLETAHILTLLTRSKNSGLTLRFTANITMFVHVRKDLGLYIWYVYRYVPIFIMM
jgi:hypothetical protein